MKRVRRNRASAIVFIAALLLQTIFANIGMTLQVQAEGNTEPTILADGVILEENEEDETAVVQFDWTLHESVNTEETYRANIPENTAIAEEQSGVLLHEEKEVGSFLATEKGEVSIQFDDGIEGLEENATGSFTVDVVVEKETEAPKADESEQPTEEEAPEEAGEKTEEPAGDEEERNNDTSEVSVEGSDNQKEGNTFAEEPKEITENIIKNFKLLKKDGTAFEDGEFIEIDEDLRFELDWALPNDHEYKSGDYFKFQLPKQLNVYSEIENGDLGDYGSFDVDFDGNVTITFSKKIEEESNVNGEFWFGTELREAEISSSTEILEIVLNDDVTKKITVNVKPTGGQAIHKEGEPVDGSFNTEEIQWTVLVNTTRDNLKNAVVTDPILDGQELDLDSIVLEEVEVDLSGNVVEELGAVTDFTNKSTTEALNIALGNTNKAYQLTFKTTMTEDEKDNEGTKPYSNIAYLNSDGQNEKQSGASVSVERPKSMEKTSSNFNKGDRSVEWTVNANFNEKNLSVGDVITDEFTFTVGDQELNDVFEIIEADITIEQVDKFNHQGKATEKSNAKDLFDINIDGNKVTYKLKEDTSKAFVITYKTQAKDGTIVNENGTIVNSVDLNGNTDTSSSGVVQQVGTKTNAGINYEAKTIDWAITINADKQDLKNFVLKDEFAGSGQKLVPGTIKINPDLDGATITPNANEEGFEIDFGDITDSYTITYQTKFTYDFEDNSKPNFKNGVNITYETSDGNDYELEIGDTVNPNQKTKSNGAKNGTANNDTKEMTWTVDINYNQLDLTGAKVIDEIADNQSLIDGTVKVYETTIASGGKVIVGDDVTDQFSTTAEENLVKVDFGNIDQSYRVEFVTKDKDGIYNSNEEYKNTAQFIPREGEKHDLEARVTLPHQGKFLGKKGLHNKEDWTIDWEIDVNKSKSTITDVTVDDNLGSTDVQILLEGSIEVTKIGSNEELVEGEDYNLTVDGNKLAVKFPGEIRDHYVVKYSSYIVAEEDVDINNEAEITSVEETIVGSTEKTETVSVKFSTGGGSGEGETGGLTIEKSETGSKRALEGIEFNLVKTVGSEDIVVREGTTDADGKLEWKGLKFGDYTLNEVIPEGYLGEESRTVNISSEDPEGVKVLPIANERETGTAKIIKVDSVTGDTLKGATFKLTNETTGQTYEFTTESDGVIEKEVPFGAYTVEEVKAPEGYRVTEDIENITVEIDKTTTITVENVAFVDVAGQKTWHVDNEQELPESITVKLIADGKEVGDQVVTSENDWKYSFKDLDKYSRANKEINYEIEEVEVDGYLSEKDGHNLINTQTTDISVNKTWVDDNDATGNRPESIIVQVLKGKEVVVEEKVTADDNWMYTFTDLPKYDETGDEIDYTINELAVDGYETNINGYTITNVRQDTTSVQGEKIWKDEDPTNRPKSIEVNLTREVNDEVDKDFSKTKTVKPDSQGNWIYEFDELEEFDENGVVYTYIIEERNVPENYESTVEGYDITNVRIGETIVSGTKRWKDDKVTDRPASITVNLLRNNVVVDQQQVTADDEWKYTFTELDKYDENGKYYDYTIKEEQVPGYAPEITGDDITNTRSEKTSIEITKGWLDDDSAERPESVIVYVYQNGDLFDTVEVKAAEDWNHELTDLEAYDKDGQPYTYTIKEKAVEGYASTVDGFNITNLRVGETEVSGEKTWKDNDDATGDRPESITVNLLQNGVKIDSQEVTAADDWKYSFEELDKYDDQGVLYGYTIDEEPVEGYEKSGKGTDLTNTRTGTTEVVGEKIWMDNDDATGDRPDEITVHLLQNGTLFTTATVTTEDDWQYSFEHLPRFDENGVEWGYTVDEVDVDGYAKSADGNNLVNTRVGTTEVTGEKIWQDNNDATGDRPDSITVHLLQNGTIFATEEVTAEDNWEYSFEHLPRFDDNGVEWGYTVDEVDVDGYAKSADGNNLINTRVGKTEVSGTKTWLDNDDATGDRPASITVELLQNGELFTTTEVTADDNWQYSFTHLPQYDDKGVAYDYTVQEIVPENYVATVDGHDITNLRVGTIEVTGEKVWEEVDSQYRPDIITVNLLANGEKVDSIEVSDETDWTFTFKELDAFDSEGTAIDYTIEEVNVHGYTSEVEGYTITNTQETTELSGTKTWIDQDNARDDRPDSITVQVLNDDSVVQEQEVEADEEGNWTFTFTELPKYDQKGNEIEYSINELPVPGYTTEIDGFDLTNIRSEEVVVEGTKTWKDDQESDRPESITVQLFANGEKVDSIDVTRETDWSYSFEGLAGYDTEGVAIVYTVDEVAVDGYETTINGYDITNTRTSGDPEEPETPEDPESPTTPEEPSETEKPGDKEDGNTLPKTATDIFNFILAGILLLGAGVTALFVQRRRA